MPIDLNDIAVLIAVVREQGFTAAGKVLGIPPSTVSRRVARLEAALGFTLLHRTTRSVGLTEAGRLFYERVAGVPRVVDEAIQAVAANTESPAGLLRVTAPPDDGGVIWSLLEGFLRDHPHVDMHLTHTLDKVDLIDDQIDVALRGGSVPDSTFLTAHLLFDSRILLVASPEYLALNGTPQWVEDLESHAGICMDAWAPNAIRRLDGDRGFTRVNMGNRLRANSLDTARRAAVSGLGIAPLLKLTCQTELDSGGLVEVLKGALPDSATFWALSRLGNDRSAAATALIHHITATAQAWDA